MEIKIRVKKTLSQQGQKMAEFQVEVENEVLTSCIFARQNEFRLRKVEDGKLGLYDDTVFYFSTTTVPVKDDRDIENKIEEIVATYRKVWQENKKWEGEKEYRYKI